MDQSKTKLWDVFIQDLPNFVYSYVDTVRAEDPNQAITECGVIQIHRQPPMPPLFFALPRSDTPDYFYRRNWIKHLPNISTQSALELYCVHHEVPRKHADTIAKTTIATVKQYSPHHRAQNPYWPCSLFGIFSRETWIAILKEIATEWIDKNDPTASYRHYFVPPPPREGWTGNKFSSRQSRQKPEHIATFYCIAHGMTTANAATIARNTVATLELHGLHGLSNESLVEIIKQCATEWIAKNDPEAWYRDEFSTSAVQTSALPDRKL